MDFSRLNSVFFAEVSDLLSSMEEILLRVKAGEISRDDVDALFRAVHTIKGSSGVFGFERIEKFSAGLENLLERLRIGQIEITDDMIDFLFAARDHAENLAQIASEESTTADPALDAEEARLGTWLARLGQASGNAAAETVPALDSTPAGTPRTWEIILDFQPDTFRHGFDPGSFLRHLTKLGTLESVRIIPEKLPVFADFDAESCYVTIVAVLLSDADEAQVRGSFDLLGGDCRVTVEEKKAVAVSDPSVNQPASGTGGEGTISAGAAAKAGLIRVEAGRLDRLVNLVGELVITSAHLDQVARSGSSSGFREVSESLGKLVREIRESALQLRMVPVEVVFSRFRRIVRDISHDLGKDVELVIQGGDAELDRTITDRLADPLLHLVRNSIDHGIETAAERAAAGKSRTGLVRLTAYASMGEVIIEIGDDGRGFDRQRILERARKMGKVGATENLSDREIDQLIFLPGLSTSREVTNLSGRGVGMDVVAQAIQALRGTVQVESHTGKGTTFRIRLPLTLALLDGFLVRVGEYFCVVPLEVVSECLEASAIANWDRSKKFIDLRGEAVPFLDLTDVFGTESAGGRRSVVVIRTRDRKAAFLVDRLIGSIQSVIKPAGRVLSESGVLAGTTILGDGSVAIVLSIDGVMERMKWQGTDTPAESEALVFSGTGP